MLTIAHEQKAERSSYFGRCSCKRFRCHARRGGRAIQTPPLSNLESEDSVETVTQSKPDYRPPTQAVEHRTTFTVGPSSNPQTGDDKSTKQESNATEVLEKPSSTIGDDFDVEW